MYEGIKISFIKIAIDLELFFELIMDQYFDHKHIQ
jgi:hypothetical protein